MLYELVYSVKATHHQKLERVVVPAKVRSLGSFDSLDANDNVKVLVLYHFDFESGLIIFGACFSVQMLILLMDGI